MSSETERNDRDAVGIGAALGLAESETPVVGRNASLRTRLAAAVGGGRGPHPDRTGPPPQRILAVVAVWTFVLALGGIVVGMAALVRIIAGGPGWFEPVIILVGLAGMGLTVGGFATVQRQLLPWVMLLGATAALVLGAVLTASG